MMQLETSQSQRRIRSFVRREGRFTAAQRKALEQYWPRYGLDPGARLLDLDRTFGRRAERYLEIGFGNGDTLASMASLNPDVDYLGIEVHRPGVGQVLNRLRDEGIGNVRLICADAVEVLRHNIPDQSLNGVFLFFPDPWPKKRHHKRRIVQPEFLQLVRRKLYPEGYIHMATDWEDYAHHMLAMLAEAPGFQNATSAGGFAERPVYRPVTRFERRGQRLGHGVWDLVFRRIG
jgi:tRNA (guanine-N7-)-methyltransferase